MVVTCAPPGSPVAAVLNRDAAIGPDTQFLRSMEHSLRWLVWAKTEGAANRSTRPPEPVRFEWEDAADSDGFTAEAMTVEDVNDFLGWTDLIAAENARRAEAGRPLIPT